MRRWSLLKVVPPLLALATASVSACEDEAADPFVDEVVNWRLFCTSGSCVFKGHQENDTVEISVKSCSRDGTGISFTLEASIDEERGIPRSTIRVQRLDPAAKTCIVDVNDTQEIGTSAVDVQDTCMNTAGNQGCEVTGSLDSDGWDFSGTLLCTNMKQDGDPLRTYRLANISGTLGVPIKIDNCD